MTTTLPYSKGQIDRAGKTLRRALLAREPLPSEAEQAEATFVLEAFREAHRGPMDSVMDELRSCIVIEGLAVLELSEQVHAWLRLLSRSHALSEMGAVPGLQHQLELAKAAAAAITTIVQELGSQEGGDG